MNMTNATVTPYFERVPRYGLPALQAAWDKAHAGTFGTLAIFTGFCRDMDEIGFEKPSKPEMSEWIGRVQKGEVARPGPITSHPAKGLVEAVEASGEASSHAMSEGAEKPFHEDALAKVRADARKKLRDACLDEVDDVTDEMVQQAQKTARRMLAEILRELAAEMEAA